MRFRLRTLLGFGAPVVCAGALILVLVEFRDYLDAYPWLAAPYAVLGVVAYLTRRNVWASAFFLVVAISLASFAGSILIGEGTALFRHHGPREEPGTAMGVGIIGFLEWATVLTVTPIGIILWWLTTKGSRGPATLNQA
jgi:hypothetical protein